MAKLNGVSVPAGMSMEKQLQDFVLHGDIPGHACFVQSLISLCGVPSSKASNNWW